MGRVNTPILSGEQLNELEQGFRHGTSHCFRMRCQSVLLKAEGRKSKDVASTGFASGGLTCKLGALCFYETLVINETLCSETRPNAKPENVMGNLKQQTRKR